MLSNSLYELIYRGNFITTTVQKKRKLSIFVVYSTLNPIYIFMKPLRHLKLCLLITISVLYLFTNTYCTTILYAPNMHAHPMIEEKGDVSVAAAASSHAYILTGQAQAAYSPKNNIGIVANGFYTQKNQSFGYLAEAGAGYFNTFHDNFRYEVYAGAGYSGQRQGQPLSLNSKLNFVKLYVQPALGFTSPYFDTFVSCRLANINFVSVRNFDGKNPANDTTYVNQDILYTAAHRSALMWEPAVTIRAGVDRFKGFIQLGGSAYIAGNNLRRDGLYLGLGAVYKFKVK